MSTSVVDDNREAHRQMTKNLLWWSLWAFIAFGGWNQIYTQFSGTGVITDKIWLPKEYRMLNQVNDKVVKVSDFQTALPTVTIDTDDFIRAFSSADIAVTSRVHQWPNPPQVFVTYSAVKGGVVYSATQKYTHGRMDKVEWMAPDILRHEGRLTQGPWLSGFAWAVFCFVMFFSGPNESSYLFRLTAYLWRGLRAHLTGW